MKAFWLYTPSLALFIAGVAHCVVAPTHADHAPAHGLFFFALGQAQILWAILWAFLHVKRGARPQTNLLWVGIGLSGAVLILWMLAQAITAPFIDTAEALDSWGVVTKVGELVAFATLALGGEQRAKRLPKLAQRWKRPTYPKSVIASVGIGVSIWFVALMAEPLLPDLQGTAFHSASVPVAGTVPTAAYMTLINSGREVETLVSATTNNRGNATLHQTVLNGDVARMVMLDGVDLPPHTRVSLSDSGTHIMLDGMPGDLYEGDHVEMTLTFASGKQITIPFAALFLPPEEQINFTVIDNFQISNAWVRATADERGAVLVSTESYNWQLPPGFPLPRVPASNPMTAEKVELGRFLFYDTRLSGNGTMACSSCHLQDLAFTDGKPLAIGSTGEVHARNSISLTNSAYSATLNWAHPTLVDLEEQALVPMFGEAPVEMGITGNEQVVLNRLRENADYQGMFAAAYPDQADAITFDNIRKALSSFTRTLISGTSPYDQYLRGDTDALSESAIRGMEMFFSESFECHHCHTGFNFSLSTASANTTFAERPFFNTGLYNIDGNGSYPPDNHGVYEITNDPLDMGRFRPPTLRNVELTGPYMHDGSVATLEEVIDFYAAGGRLLEDGEYAGDGRANPFKSGFVPGFTLTEQEKADLIAFLVSLTDEQFITDPRFSDPFLETGG